MSERQCRVCTITNLEGLTDHDGSPSCWADDDLCSDCADGIAEAEKRDASRYRYLRDGRTGSADLDAGGLCAGKPAEGLVLGGEDLDRAIDGAMAMSPPTGETLERRLADCLADAIDTPVMKVRDTLGGSEIELRLGAWLPELSERAAELLEEAGR